MSTKSASFGPYVITRDDNNKITVTNNGVVENNTMAALREISSQCGFTINPDWNTQQSGAKLIAFLENGGGNPAPVAPKADNTAAKQEAEATKTAAPAKTKEQKDAENKALEKKVEGSAADIAGARVRVYGKAQNRTALGIMHAYMVMYPQAKLEDIQKEFPDSLNPDSGVKMNFVYAEDKGTSADWNGFFKGEDEVLTMGDGKKVSVVSMWTKPSFERLVAWAKQYGIVVADFEAAKGGGVKGGFRLEYLNGYVPPKPKKGIPFWVWIIIALAILGLLAGLLFGKKERVVEKVVTETVVVHDTLYIQQIEEIEKNFNAAQFELGKADLSDDAKFVLHDLANVMQKNPQIRLKLEGHTSAEGDAALNQKLSEARAAAAVTFLVEHEGIDASRLESVGLGSSQLKNAADPNSPENRRTEFVVVE